MSFYSELKRRNVFRVAVFYLVASWLLLQVADVLFDQLAVPEWSFRLVLGILMLGFPLVLIFSWVFELTPEGLKRERDVERGQSITHDTGRKLNITIVVLLILAIAGLIADRLIPERTPDTRIADVAEPTPLEPPETSAGSGTDRSVAVLPFANMSGDPENEYFSDGLSEELLNSLVQIKDLKVTGRTSSFAFKGQNLDLREIGRLLNVAHVLEGSVRKAGNRVRITAQLVKTSDGYHLWSEAFDRELDDIFAIQQEIAARVADALSVTLLGNEVSGPKNTNAQAYEEYLRGMYLHQRQPDDLEALQRAQEFFEKALSIDDAYAPGYYGLFRVWNGMNRNGHVPFYESLKQMRVNAEKLEELEPGSARALQTRARLSAVNLDWHAGLAAIEEAYRRFPGDSDVLTEYSTFAILLKSPGKAVALILEALALDPLSLEAQRRLALVYSLMGDCDGTREVVERAMAVDSGLSRFNYFLAICLLQFEGDLAGAMALAEIEPLGFMHHTALAIMQQTAGNPAAAQAHVDSMFESYGESASFQFAQVYAQWGDTERALEWLERAMDVRDPGVVTLLYDPFMEPLRDEPRFQAVLQRAGFADPPRIRD